MSKLSVVIPCFNEEKMIDTILNRVEAVALPKDWTKEIIIVDDNSTDSTREKLSKYKNHTIVLRKTNGGKGAAIKDGFKKATGDYIIIQDADLEYDPNEYPVLISALNEKNTIVFGSRNLTPNQFFSLMYGYGGKTLTAAFNLIFRSSFTDITTCYKLFPIGAVDRLIQWPENDFVYDAVYLTYELYLYNKNIVEVPIHYKPRSREDGKKINWKHGVRSLIAMIKIRILSLRSFFSSYSKEPIELYE